MFMHCTPEKLVKKFLQTMFILGITFYGIGVVIIRVDEGKKDNFKIFLRIFGKNSFITCIFLLKINVFFDVDFKSTIGFRQSYVVF